MGRMPEHLLQSENPTPKTGGGILVRQSTPKARSGFEAGTSMRPLGLAPDGSVRGHPEAAVDPVRR